MKKNRMMRLASVLLVCVLLTTSVISGTFAKYVTSAEATDSARVAKWGISMNSTGSDTFVGLYDSSVDAIDDKDVVAPGTSRSAVYQISGQPETDYVVTFKGTMIHDIYLGKGTYTYTPDAGDDITYVGMGKTMGDSDKYFPLTYKLKIETTNGTEENFVAGTVYSYATLAEAMAALTNCKVLFDANEGCDVKVTLTWEWPFAGQDDAADTVLGDLIANNEDLTVSAERDYSLTVQFEVEMTATQVD